MDPSIDGNDALDRFIHSPAKNEKDSFTHYTISLSFERDYFTFFRLYSLIVMQSRSVIAQRTRGV